MKARLLHWLIPQLIRLVILFLKFTIRWECQGWRYDAVDPARHIFAFWHARLLMIPAGMPGCRGYALISEHRDGAYIADTIELLGFRSVRGSSTRGGARALLQMVKLSRSGDCDFGITPDGPKGPREKVTQGTVALVKKTGMPLRPVCWATKRHWRITSSWDHFYIPKPFTRGVFVIGEPLTIADDEDEQSALERVQQAMDALQQQADHYFD